MRSSIGLLYWRAASSWPSTGTIPSVDDPSIARPDYATTAEDTPVTFDILSNDWDDYGFTLTSVWTSDIGASWWDNGDGTVT